jgi:Arc/MetJ family transcription regulator
MAARLTAAMHQKEHQMMLEFVQRSRAMRTTLSLDDALLEEAISYTGLSEKSALVREALTALIERESSRRLARLGGSEPQLRPIPRRRSAK